MLQTRAMPADKPPHPGRLKIYNGKTNALIDDLDASKLSEGLTYAKTSDGWEAVTSIVEIVDGDRLSWSAFNADGKLLKRGTSRRS